jgi:RNA polymerase sigma-70 factor (ECF subfamily)
MLRSTPPARLAEELALAQRCAAGDTLAQRALFERLRVSVHRTLFRILGSNRQIEDLVQDTFMEAFKAIGSFRGESSLSTWIGTIATRVCFRYLAQRAALASTSPITNELVAPTDDPEHLTLSRQAVQSLYAVLDRIAPTYRIAYTLHVIDERPLDEVARLTRTTSLVVKTRIWRARKMLRERALRDPCLAELLCNASVAG